ncbi:hypothetical protein HKX48_002140 [Thoreauomyces humboldtii]|nr:hypothetical protein HKX48_002140 [Thoreauomyces humboldtii]
MMLSAAALLLSFVAPFAATASTHLHKASTPSLGTVAGIPCSSRYTQYLGIPFAAPPVGALRWAPPQPIAKYDSFNASVAPNACSQKEFNSSYAPTSEASDRETNDCLYLNVYGPTDVPRKSGLPVRVFIHGGSLTSGSASFPYYYGCPTAEQTHSIVVVIQYRLDVFGFLSHPALKTADGIEANWGLQDQQFALRWVKDNIAGFGGDPKRVSIFGESSGGDSVFMHLVSPKSKGLFSSAVIESGGTGALIPCPSLEFAKKVTEKYAKTLGCTADNLASCLRKLDSLAILDASPTVVPGPADYPDLLRTEFVNGANFATFVIDGVLVPKQLKDSIAAGEINKVPVLAGTNKAEAELQMLPYGVIGETVLTKDNYTAYIKESVPTKQVDQVLALYPLSAYPANSAPYSALADMMTDQYFACPTIRGLRLLKEQGVPVFQYWYSQTLSCPFMPIPDWTSPSHFAEIPMVRLIHTIGAAWTSMAQHGTPGGGWPAFPDYGELNTARSGKNGLTFISKGKKQIWWNERQVIRGRMVFDFSELIVSFGPWFCSRCPMWDAINDNAVYRL